MKLLISYPQTSWDYVKFRLNRIIKGKDKSNDVFKGAPGGKIQLLEQKQSMGQFTLINEIYPSKPFGMHYVPGEGLYFITGLPCSEDGVSGDEHIVRLNDAGEIDLTIRSPLFSQLRSLRRTERGLMVTSSGIDAILEVDLEGNIIWSWYATEHGYAMAYNGENREIDKNIDHRLFNYPGKLQTTHLNSAIVDPYDPGKILTILFYQGKVARIDRETLEHECVINDLNGAHHIRPHSEGYMLANSRKGEVHIYDKKFQLIDKILGTTKIFPVKWVQDAIETSIGSYLIADCNTFNLRELDVNTGKKQKFNTQMPNRIFQFEPVPDSFTLRYKE